MNEKGSECQARRDRRSGQELDLRRGELADRWGAVPEVQGDRSGVAAIVELLKERGEIGFDRPRRSEELIEAVGEDDHGGNGGGHFVILRKSRTASPALVPLDSQVLEVPDAQRPS